MIAHMTTSYRLDADTGPAWVVHVNGNLEGQHVDYLRREWWRLRNVDNALPLLVEVGADVFVDKRGNLLLAEMQWAGAHIVFLPCGSRDAAASPRLGSSAA